MNSKKILAILSAFAMLLVMVPMFAVSTSADATEPQLPKGAYNYAIGAGATYAGCSNTYDTENGYMNLTPSGWAGASFTVAAKGITKDDDYVVSFWLKKAETWGNGGTEFTFSATDTFSIPCGANTTTYSNGATTADVGVLAAQWNFNGGYRLTFHFNKPQDGVRTVDIFAGGAYKATISDVEAKDPVFTFKTTYSNPNYANEFNGLRIFKYDADATEFEPMSENAQAQTAGLAKYPAHVALPAQGDAETIVTTADLALSGGATYDGTTDVIDFPWKSWGTPNGLAEASVDTLNTALYGKSYVVTFSNTNLGYSNGWWKEAYIAKVGGKNISLRIASNGITYYGTDGAAQAIANSSLLNTHTIAAYVRRSANTTTNIIVYADGNLLDFFTEQGEPDPQVKFVGAYGGSGTAKVGSLKAYEAPDEPGVPARLKEYEVKVSWCDMSYSITGVIADAGTVYSAPHTYKALEGSDITITAVSTEAKYGAIKNGNNGWSWLSAGTYTVEDLAADWNFVVQGGANPTVTITKQGEGEVQTTGISANNYVPRGGSFNVTAVAAEGWSFDHWVVGNASITEATHTFTGVTENTSVEAIFVEDVKYYDVNVQNAIGGYGIGGGEGFAYGETVNLSAVAAEGYFFKYWLINGRLISDNVVALSVNGDITAIPVFAAKESDSYAIKFYTADGRFIAEFDSVSFDSGSDLPAVPARYGYDAIGWDYVWEDGITSNVDVYPQYIKNSALFTIAVNGGTASARNAQFESIIHVVADTADGFVGWKNAAGEFVSTSANYTFFAVGDTELTAVYGEEQPAYTITVIPNSLNENIETTTFKLNIIGETFVNEDYTMIERGIVYATGDQTEETLMIGKTGVKKKMSTSTGNGQFMYTLTGAPRGETITARAYMVISDGDTQTIVYSGLCDCTVPAAE